MTFRALLRLAMYVAAEVAEDAESAVDGVERADGQVMMKDRFWSVRTE